jgi:hypothetical protein
MNENQDHEIDANDSEMSSLNEETTAGGETNRRELLMTAGALGIAALLGTASASAQEARGGTASQRRFDPELFSHENLTKFVGLVAKIWENPDLARMYERDPRGVLAKHGIKVEKGIPTPVIPKQPKGGISNIGDAWKRNDFAAADLLIKQVGGISMNPTTNTQSSLGTAGCPLSTFASFGCWIVASDRARPAGLPSGVRGGRGGDED